VVPKCDEKGRDPAVYESDEFPCVYRELRTVKDDRGRYIDPFRMMRTMPDGRRLIYDTTHPDLMYGSQWSSELADAPSCYSFPVTLDFDAEIPWKKDLQWQVSWLEYTIHRQLGQVVHTCHLCTSVS